MIVWIVAQRGVTNSAAATSTTIAISSISTSCRCYSGARHFRFYVDPGNREGALFGQSLIAEYRHSFRLGDLFYYDIAARKDSRLHSSLGPL